MKKRELNSLINIDLQERTNKSLVNESKKSATDLIIANKELVHQNKEKEKRAAELVIANKEKGKRAAELIIADKELAYQNEEKEKRAAELVIANKELIFQNEEKEKRVAKLIVANKEIAYQNKEKEKRAAELVIANKELTFQNEEKEKRAAELIIANKELTFQNKEKEKRAAELVVANKELAFQNEEKEKRAAELIAANKKLASQEELIIANAYLDNLIGCANAPIIIWNPQGCITRFNPAFEFLTGRLSVDVLGKTLDILFPPSQVKKSMELIQETQFAKNRGTVDIKIMHINGSIHTVLWNSATIFTSDGKTPVATLAQCQDITERKRAEEEIQRINRDLETLLYITSHDLREPLRSIQNFSQMVNERYADRLDEKGKDFLRRVVRGAERLDHLLEDVLQLSRIQHMEAPNEGINSQKIVNEVLLRLESKIKETKATVIVEPNLPILRVNKTWTTQAIYNLVANALKFTRADEPPEIEIGTYNVDNQIGLVVRDRGTGVAPEHAERIFQLFQRAVGREVEGTGAGLAIVHQVAERHGGRAWVQPREGGGSEFIITFKEISHDEKGD